MIIQEMGEPLTRSLYPGLKHTGTRSPSLRWGGESECGGEGGWGGGGGGGGEVKRKGEVSTPQDTK